MKKLKYLWLAALPATVLLGVLLLSAISQAYYINEADYGIVEGVSYYVDNKTEAYRVDFEKAEWDIDSTTERIYRYRSSGQTIRGTQVLAFTISFSKATASFSREDQFAVPLLDKKIRIRLKKSVFSIFESHLSVSLDITQLH